jgi:6-pyruvoyl-tetrahydropterin synthase
VYEVPYETTFCATHALLDRGCPIEPLDGHDGRVGVVASGDRLDSVADVLDFEVLKNAVAERFHYKAITSDSSFEGASPTPVAVARLFFEEGGRRLGEDCALLRQVRVWEAPGRSAAYSAA